MNAGVTTRPVSRAAGAWAVRGRGCVAAGVVGLLCSACERHDAVRNHLFLTGSVTAIQRESPPARAVDFPARNLQLTLRLPLQRGDESSDRERELNLSCLVGPETEVYINDQFRSADLLTIGDTVDVFGYRDAGAPTERVVARLIYVTRPEPPPREPNLPLTTQPSPISQESTPWPTAP